MITASIEEGEPIYLRGMIEQALASPDEETVLIGLTLLSREPSGRFPDAAVDRLRDASPRIRSATAEAIPAVGDLRPLPALHDALSEKRIPT